MVFNGLSVEYIGAQRVGIRLKSHEFMNSINTTMQLIHMTKSSHSLSLKRLNPFFEFFHIFTCILIKIHYLHQFYQICHTKSVVF